MPRTLHAPTRMPHFPVDSGVVPCSTSDRTDQWHPTNAAELAAAQRTCTGCRVRKACHDMGVTTKQSGVWGGHLLRHGTPSRTYFHSSH